MSHAARRNLASRVPSRVTRHRGVCTRSTRVRGAPTLAPRWPREVLSPSPRRAGWTCGARPCSWSASGASPSRLLRRDFQNARRSHRDVTTRGCLVVETSRRRDVGARKTSRSRFTFAPRKLSLTRILLRPLHRLAQEERVAAACLALELGANVVGADANPKARRLEKDADARRRRRARAGKLVRTDLGPHETHAGSFVEADVIILSPGVPLTQPQVAAALAQGEQEVLSELAFAFRTLAATETDCFLAREKGAAPTKKLAVTGTNGKSTTCAFAGQLIRACGKRAFVGGNLGVPLSLCALEDAPVGRAAPPCARRAGGGGFVVPAGAPGLARAALRRRVRHDAVVRPSGATRGHGDVRGGQGQGVRHSPGAEARRRARRRGRGV